MNTKKIQTYVALSTKDWSAETLVRTLEEIVASSKEYENDYVEIHQVLETVVTEVEVEYVIILNHTRNLDDLGKCLK
ncbi:hypothetical protein JFU18_10300 [Bacillus sp. TH22]|uniref:hypothetical protein n=1 Tax=Bacillus sp. TH22 TaxID=2796388 RepID=UPI0019116DB6|nr:hypothetical protein [Bacillus sp. TH22]MBK5449024.1 hypothetical protein [Bacillus sp. TH22]